MKIGDRFRRLREQKQFSLGDIAQRTGLTYTDLYKIEDKHQLPPFEILERIADALEVEPHELLFDGSTPPPLSNFLMLQSADSIAFGIPRDASLQIPFHRQGKLPDSWLNHADAARYLGISKSTLYHYSCQEQIERTKIGGRLEYRRSALDRFKESNTFPARRRPNAEHIIPSAHSSGK